MNSDSLRIITWNSRGIRNKLSEFFDFLNRFRVDVALVSETWLKNDILMSHSDFICYRRDRDYSRGGGVAIVVRRGIHHEMLPVMDTGLIENIGISITFTDRTTMSIFACYFPGGAAGPSNVRKDTFKSDLRKFSRIQGEYIVGGDFNCRSQNWGCARANCWGNILNDMITSNAFDMVYPPEPTLIPSTRNSVPSVLDFFLTNVPERLSAALTMDNLNSDHLPVLTTFDSRFLNDVNMRFDYKNANWNIFRRHLDQGLVPLLEEPIILTDDIDSLINRFTLLINNSLDFAVPKRNCRNSYSKRLPRSILNLITLRNISRRNWKRYRLNHYRAEMAFLNRIIESKIAEFRNMNWNNMLRTLDKSSPQFWKISKILRKRTRCIPCLKVVNNVYTTNVEKSNILARKFHSNHSISANLSDQDTIRMVTNSLLDLYNHNDDDIIHISEDSIRSVIKSLKNRKSPGLDGITNNCLKQLPPSGIHFLSRIFNSCVEFAFFPTEWKKSKVIAIPKPGKKMDNPESYRPINLLNSTSKIFERVLKEKIVSFIEENNILPQQQFGFRAEHNTVQPLVRIKNIVKNNFSNGRSTAMVLLDIRAAFDTVWHDALVHKLKSVGLNRSLVRVISNFLSNRTFRVFVGDQHSNEYDIPAGCPQGSCLSPILYNIYTHDFPPLMGCESSIFADDTAILSSGTISADILTNLQNAVDSITEYFNRWKILINSTKTNAIFFTRKRKSIFLPQSKIRVGNADIDWLPYVKYLGVMLDRGMIFNEHVSYTIHRINLTTRILYAFINRKSDLSMDNKMLIFKLIFQSILFYGAPVWHDASDCHIKRLQIAQNKLLKMIYNLPYFFSTSRLHSLHNVPYVKDKINIVTNRFFEKCSYSQFQLINALST